MNAAADHRGAEGREHWTAPAVRLLAAAALFAPLVTADLGFSALFTKAVIFQGIVALMAGLWIPLAIADRRYRPDWRSPVVLAAVGYALVSVLLLPASLDPTRSFWSTGIRMTGIVFTLHLALWVLALTSVFRGPATRPFGWCGLVAVASAVGLVADAVALRQHFALGLTRAIGTLDNPIFLASFCVANFWLTAWLAAQEKRRLARVLLALAAAAHLGTVLVTGTRAAVIAVFVSALAYAALVAWRRLHDDRAGSLVRRHARTWFLLAAALLLAAGLAATWQLAGGARGWGADLPPVLSRLTNTNFGEDRLALWQIAGEGFLARPIFGWGQENFQAVFNRLVDPAGLGWALDASWYDRVHNQFLETLVAQGLVGLASYLALFAAAAYVGFRLLKRGTPGAAALLAFFAAAAVNLTFSFETPASSALFWLALALLASQDDRRQVAGGRGEARPSPIVLALALAAAVSFIWLADLRPLQALDRYTVAMVKVLSEEDRSGELAAALNMNQPYRSSLLLEAADVMRKRRETQTGAPPAWQTYVAALAAPTARLADRHPADYRYQLAATIAYRLLGEYDPAAFATAEQYARRAVAAAPQRARAYEELADLAAARGDYAEAAGWYTETLGHTVLAPEIGRLHARLAEMSVWQGDFAVALANLRATKARGYMMENDHGLALALAVKLEAGKVAPEFLAYSKSIAEPFASRFAVLRARGVIAAKAGDEAELERVLIRAEQITPALRAAIERETREFRVSP